MLYGGTITHRHDISMLLLSFRKYLKMLDLFWQWYYLLALSRERIDEKRHAIRIWRWKGYLIQVSVITHISPSPMAYIGHFCNPTA